MTPQERLRSRSKPSHMAAIEARNLEYQAQSNATNPDVGDGEIVVKLHVTDIRPNPFQHRTSFDAEGISELTHSMKVNGQNQPIGVRKTRDGYEIIFGERRWRAAHGLEGQTVDAVIREVCDEEMNFICLSENRDRKKAYDYETYRGINNAIDQNQTPEVIMDRLNIDKTTYYKFLSFGSLPAQVREFVHNYPDAIQRNDSMQIVSAFKNMPEGSMDDAVKYTIELMQMYLDKKITSRGDIVKRLNARFVQKKSRNREKVNQDFSLSYGNSKVGSMVQTPEELRFTVSKADLPKDKLDELHKYLSEFFKINQVENQA